MRNRRVLLETRNAYPDELESFNAADKIPQEWSVFLASVGKQAAVSGNNLQTIVTDEGIVLVSFSRSLDITYSIAITREFNVKAKVSATTVSTRHILGFQHKLERWSQLGEVINCIKQATPSEKEEMASLLLRLKKYCKDETREFLLQQLELSTTQPTGRRYSPQTILHATRLFMVSRAGYRQLRSFLSLPDPKTLKKAIGPLHTAGGAAECKHVVEAYFGSLSPIQRNCAVIFDEVYVKPSLRYRGRHIIGNSADQPGALATTMLAILVKPLHGGHAFVARLIPVRALRKDFLYRQIDSVVDVIHECGGTVRALICDNHFVNKQLYQSMAPDSSKPYIGRTTNHTGIHLLYDSTHLMKNVRNNWLNEMCQHLEVKDPSSDQVWNGKFSDIRAVWAAECDETVRSTKLTYTACYPSTIERQNVQHVAAVFNEKTVASLTLAGKKETANVVHFFHRLWKILNVKNVTSHITLNDPDRQPIQSVDDASLKILALMSSSVSKMAGGKGKSRRCALFVYQLLDGDEFCVFNSLCLFFFPFV